MLEEAVSATKKIDIISRGYFHNFFSFSSFFSWSHNSIFLKRTNEEKCPDFENDSC